jgi:predicted dehydrogenase
MSDKEKMEFNRRDFLRGGSAAALMTMLGGVELVARAADPPGGIKFTGVPVKVGIIGLGGWGRELLSTLMRMDEADVAGICDNYAVFLKRSSKDAPKAAQFTDYKALLDNKDIKAVFIATPTHQHKEIAIDALKAGKHVYCEAPLAHTIEDAKAIALAAKGVKNQIFQAGLQLRAEPHRHFLQPFIRSGAMGIPLFVRAQWHKKSSWRTSSPNPEREKALNWRLDKNLSLGLMGEVGMHHIDQVGWFLNGLPKAVTGYSALKRWTDDGREIPDTVQAVFEYPGDVPFTFDATLANSFDKSYELFHGSDSAIMIRDNKAWMFQEVDSPLLGWEVYAKKETFYKSSGISLMAGASKSVKVAATAVEEDPENSTLTSALSAFVLNVYDLEFAMAGSQELYKDDPQGLTEYLAKEVKRRTAAGYLEGFRANVLGIKANEAVLARKRLELPKDLFELA